MERDGILRRFGGSLVMTVPYGHTNNPNGRPAGSRNKRTQEILVTPLAVDHSDRAELIG
jgi:hypothetical protein